MKKLLIAIALVVVTGIVAACLWFFPILKVGNVVISQRDQTSEADIAAITDGLQGQNILRVDTTAVASALSALPWVAEARVAKKFPDTIDVSLVEHRAVLVAEREDGDHLIDANGKVFVVAHRLDYTVPITNTKGDNQETFQAAVSIIASIAESERGKITEIKAVTPYSFDIIAGDKTIVWGAAENNGEKARAFSVALQRSESTIDITGAPTISVQE